MSHQHTVINSMLEVDYTSEDNWKLRLHIGSVEGEIDQLGRKARFWWYLFSGGLFQYSEVLSNAVLDSCVLLALGLQSRTDSQPPSKKKSSEIFTFILFPVTV